MNEQEQRICIAESCGWTKIVRTVDSRKELVGTHIHRMKLVHKGKYQEQFEPIPDYLHDLNAMHEAEKWLTEKHVVWYLQKLSQVRLRQGESGMIACMIDRLAFATAAQRAEAFLRTKGLWKED